MEAVAKAIKAVYEKKGYTFFDGDKPYNLNLFGVRNLGRLNRFDDWLCVLYRNSRGEWVWRQYEATTTPGVTILRAPSNSKGAAILAPGQYQGAYKIDYHGGKYEALCQRLGKVKVYRDSNRDDQYNLDPATLDEGFFGINIHRAGLNTEVVDRWSAGCQVLKYETNFSDLMKIARSAAERLGNSFTYTLFDKADFL